MLGRALFEACAFRRRKVVGMITRDDVMPLLLEACPSFRHAWETDVKESYVNLNEDGTRLHYIDAGDFALHVVKLAKSNRFAEFPAIFGVIERLHLEGDDYVKELATIGYLEDLQNIGGHHGLNDQYFEPYLLPESRRWWKGLNAFWEGRSTGGGVLPLDE